jgi:putative endonuclease
MQTYYTYVLVSEKNGHFYIGLTSSLDRRVYQHNIGKVRSTKGRRPFKLFYYEEYQNKTDARKREIFLKSGQGRLFLKRKLNNSENGKESVDSL